ncbi:IS21 family transposase [Saccharicrinis fermentans]|uniref:IS21 family transposase n=1 Tax=Saccharicrinis fermentans TaxID=982 RepID=UPI0005C7879D|nr:IS21 family transposase [Saccharicrinis fermentans]
MKKVRELLHLVIGQGHSSRQAAKIAGMSKSSASEYVSGFKTSGIELDKMSKLTDSELLWAITGPNGKQANERYAHLISLFGYIEKELLRPGVTLQLLWQELFAAREKSYSYSQFCFHYQQWAKKQKVGMHMEHKAGDKLYVDFTGVKQKIIDAATGEIREAEVFVGVLGSSQKAYIEAVESQKKADWIKVNENALRFFRGVPRCIVPDCLKSAVVKADRYEPQINATYKDFGDHYSTVILPARVLHPKDKSLAENFVKTAYTRIFAPLRNVPFFSLKECNHAMWEELDKHNGMPFQGKDYSREYLFDTVEKEELQPLPVSFYDLRAFAIVKVQYNHHVYLREDRHYYSMPFQLTGKKVQLSYNSRVVEVSYNNVRVAIHQRNPHRYGYTTDGEHRPSQHKFVSEWDADRFIRWAAKVSPQTESFIKGLIESKAHPEQAFSACMGILSESKKHAPEDFGRACKKALEMKVYTCKFIGNTLKYKTFNLDAEEEIRRIMDDNETRGLDILN